MSGRRDAAETVVVASFVELLVVGESGVTYSTRSSRRIAKNINYLGKLAEIQVYFCRPTSSNAVL